MNLQLIKIGVKLPTKQKTVLMPKRQQIIPPAIVPLQRNVPKIRIGIVITYITYKKGVYKGVMPLIYLPPLQEPL